MRKIKELPIKGSIYKIIYTDPVDSDDSLSGITHIDEKRMEILKSLKGERLDTVILHECIHAVIEECGIELNEDIEESLCKAISSWLAATFNIRVKHKKVVPSKN